MEGISLLLSVKLTLLFTFFQSLVIKSSTTRAVHPKGHSAKEQFSVIEIDVIAKTGVYALCIWKMLDLNKVTLLSL